MTSTTSKTVAPIALPFRIKVCGITTIDDAVAAVDFGADAIGLNFSQSSPRQISIQRAAEIVSALGEHSKPACTVGVFVEQDINQANEVAQRVGLDIIQLHGDHLPADAKKAQRPVLHVIRLRSGSLAKLQSQLVDFGQQVMDFGQPVGGDWGGSLGVLVDAYVEGQFGGTGHRVAWAPLADRWHWSEREPAAQQQRPAISWPKQLPLVLAGGLNSENVQTAIVQAKPEAVDVASGVESAPGIKDHRLLERFLALAGLAMNDIRAR